MAKKEKTSKNRECIACRTDIDSQNEGTRYTIFGKNNTIVGKMDVHRNGCFHLAAEVLEEQVNEAEHVDSIMVATTIGGKTMRYTVEGGHGDDIYEFRTYEYSHDLGMNRMMKSTIETLNSCMGGDGMVFVKIRRHESFDVYKMPKLMAQDDPEIPEGTFRTPKYEKRLLDAIAKYTRGMLVRGENEIEASRVLAQHVKNMMITI